MKQKTDVIISRAIPEYAAVIAQIEAECFSMPWSKKQIEDEIFNEKAIFLTALSDKNICGYISGQLIIDEFYVSNIAVSSPYRNCGIGTMLLKTLITELREVNCSLITLEVRESNFSARNLYEKTGFINLGTRKNFYSFPQENACIYTLYFNNEEKENLN